MANRRMALSPEAETVKVKSVMRLQAGMSDAARKNRRKAVFAYKGENG